MQITPVKVFLMSYLKSSKIFVKKYTPVYPFTLVSNAILKFLTEQVNRKLFDVKCKYTVTVKILKIAGKMV